MKKCVFAGSKRKGYGLYIPIQHFYQGLELGNISSFYDAVYGSQGYPLKCKSIETIQVNLGYLCNKECNHCHIRASPNRTESMNWETMQATLMHANKLNPRLIDITGGAPEMNPFLGDFITDLTKHGHNVQVRTNLTVLLDEEREGFIQLYKLNGVKLVASLPCYEEAEVDSVRGDGTFDDSIEILKRLNLVGYGIDDQLQLDLVFNPEAAFLPPNQSNLEKTYKLKLKEDFGIFFNHLIAITNMPVGRFEDKLMAEDNLESYMKLLRDNFNRDTLDGLMCRTQISIDYDGALYDCDFNLANKLPLSNKPNINDPSLDLNKFNNRTIITEAHCFGCTAGEGSSCSGALVS